jgi:hypothetical protein
MKTQSLAASAVIALAAVGSNAYASTDASWTLTVGGSGSGSDPGGLLFSPGSFISGPASLSITQSTDAKDYTSSVDLYQHYGESYAGRYFDAGKSGIAAPSVKAVLTVSDKVMTFDIATPATSGAYVEKLMYGSYYIQDSFSGYDTASNLWINAYVTSYATTPVDFKPTFYQNALISVKPNTNWHYYVSLDVRKEPGDDSRLLSFGLEPKSMTMDMHSLIASPVPEPTPIAMYACLFGLLGFSAWRRKAKH